MSLLEMIEHTAGTAALQQIGARTGLSPDQLQSAISSLAPALAPKLAQHADSGTLPPPAAPIPGSDAAADHGNDILGTIFGSKDVSRSVAADASAQTGIGAAQLKALLPQLASLAVAAIAAHQARGSAGTPAGGGLLGGLLSGLRA